MKVGKITVEYLTESDDNDRNDTMQTLTITAQPVLLHLYEKGEEDFYVVLETTRFAVDFEELEAILADFKKRIFE